MNADEVKTLLAHAPQDDPRGEPETGAFSYKKHLPLLIKRAASDSYNSYNEPWAVCHPDKKACSVEYTINYGTSYVDRKT